MLVSYEVGAIFSIDNRASGTLDEMAEQFTRLDTLATSFQEKLSAIGDGAFASLRADIDEIATAFKALDDSIEHTGQMMETGAGVMGQAADEAAKQVSTITEAWNRATDSVARYRDAVGAAATTGPGGAARAADDVLLPPGGSRGRPSRRGNPDDDNSPFGTGDDYANAQAENNNWNRRYDNMRNGANYDNQTYDDRERARVRDAQADEPFDRPGSLAEDAGAGYVGGRGSGGGHGGGGMGHQLVQFGEVIGGVEAVKTAMEEDLATRQALMGMNITESSPEYAEAFRRMHETYYTATRGTKFSESQAAEASREAAPVLAMPGMQGVEAFEKTYPIALRAGELSELRGKGSIGSEAVASEEFAHLEQNYDPEHLTKSIDLVNAIAMRTDTSIGRQLSIAKYALPTAMMAGIDPDQAMSEVGAAELRMGSTTTAGTGYSRFVLGALHSGGGINSHLSESTRTQARRAEHEFEQAYKLDPTAQADAQHAKTSAHDAALIALGITDQSGKLLDVTSTGGLDVERVKEQIGQYSGTHERQDTLNTIQNAFGTYGGRYASAYMNPEMLEREHQQTAAFRGAPSVQQEQEGLSHSPMQQFEQMLANTANIGNTLATTTLPGLNAAFQAVNAGLVGFDAFLKQHETAAEVGGYGVLAAIGTGGLGLLGLGASKIGGGLGAIYRGVKGVGSYLGGGEAGGAAEAAEAVGGSALGSTIGLGILTYLADQAHSGLESGSNYVEDLVFGQGHHASVQAVINGGGNAGPNPDQTASGHHAIDFFIKNGWTAEQAAGIAGNLQQESSFNPLAGIGSAHQGIAQWDAPRQAATEKQFGKSLTQMSYDEQLKAVQWELTQGGSQAAGAALHGATTAPGAASIVDRQYEMPGNYWSEDIKRASNAQQMLAGWQGAAPAVTSGIPGIASAAAATTAPAQTPQVTIHLGPVTMNGVQDDGMIHTLITKLTDGLKAAMSHASGSGQGSDSSIYVIGGP